MNLDHWTRGYTQAELDDAQAKFGLVFPPDLVALLRERRPVRGHDWADEAAIRSMLEWPLEGLLFDIEHNALWWSEWGERPDHPEARAEVLRSVLSRAPKLIPLLSHRYLPEQPHESGNPVFSVYQADVIHYGANLEDYFEREFNGWGHRPWPDQIRYVPFWSDLVERNC
ncbi:MULTISPECIES: hypothetical protein [unclassified Bradyrhizobium]|uniref:hypothetical protein n=1 Tax=unclassified Bradyrhizobium TaxID=2631580 RepID=UPI0028E97086|nr:MULTISPECIES: hypothetical protein [unclassified Bradyrhizobium]